jgi:transposase InsO family protein
MGIRESLTAPRAPWPNPFVERVIGSIRRECLDHFLILSDAHLRRLLRAYLAYYKRCGPIRRSTTTVHGPARCSPQRAGV